MYVHRWSGATVGSRPPPRSTRCLHHEEPPPRKRNYVPPRPIGSNPRTRPSCESIVACATTTDARGPSRKPAPAPAPLEVASEIINYQHRSQPPAGVGGREGLNKSRLNPACAGAITSVPANNLRRDTWQCKCQVQIRVRQSGAVHVVLMWGRT